MIDLEHLTKTQIILLVLLVSFVTSIATGIVTVTLLDQAPPAVTQTINRVVERTVERVVPDQNNNPITTKETTIVVKEDDLITASIEKTRGSLVKIVKVEEVSGSEPIRKNAGLGVAVTDSLIAVDQAIAGGEGVYLAVLPDGKEFPTERVSGNGEGSGIAIRRLRPLAPGGGVPKLTPIKFADMKALKLGSTLISLSGIDRLSVHMGIVAGLNYASSTSATLIAVETNIDTTKVQGGAPAINIFGELVAISTTAATAASLTSFTPQTAITEEIAAIARAQP